MLERIQIGSDIFVAYDMPVSSNDCDTVSIMMINSNKDKNTGLAFVAFDSGNKKLLFNVTGRITLGEYLRNNLSQEEFRLLILNLVNTIEGFDEYMIDVANVLLDLNSVYINLLDKSIVFVCVPVKGFVSKNSLYGFFKDVVANCYVDVSTNGFSYFDCVRNVMRNENGFSLNNIRVSMNETKPQNNASVDRPSASVNLPNSRAGIIEDKVEEFTKVEQPREVTVNNTPKVDKPVQSPIPQEATKEKKGGILSRIFSPKEKKSETKQVGFQGGLAGYTSGGKTNSQPAINPTQPTSNSVPQGSSNRIGGFSGTTVLNDGKNNPQQNNVDSAQRLQVGTENRAAQVSQGGISGTTVLNGGITASPTQINQNIGRERPGTTVLREGVSSNSQPGDSVPVNRTGSAETTVLNPQGAYGPATTVLNKSMQSQCFLIRVKNHQRLHLTKQVIHIGRDLPELDFNLNDNTAVGHRHANIVQRGNGYCLIDLQSKNHTYLNGQLLESGKEYPLSNQDKIRFANEEFEYMIM